MKFSEEQEALVCYRQGETLRIEPWGTDALRVRATRYASFSGNDWALCGKPEGNKGTIQVDTAPIAQGSDEIRRITNGRISCEVNCGGVLSFFRDGTLILRVHFRNYEGTISPLS